MWISGKRAFQPEGREESKGKGSGVRAYLCSGAAKMLVWLGQSVCGVGSIGDGGRKMTGVRGRRGPGHEDLTLSARQGH